MKAEHRKELHTNLLADRMGRLVQGMKSGPQATSAAIWVIVGLAVVTFGAWYFTSGNQASQAETWARLDGDREPDQFARVADDQPNSLPGRSARFQYARLRLREGLAMLCPSPALSGNEQAKQRTQAIGYVVEARQLYNALGAELQAFAREGADERLLSQEALLGSAQAEEALVKAPAGKEDEGARGDLKRALELYHQYLDRARPEGLQGQDLAAQVQELENQKKDRQALPPEQAWWLAVARHVLELEKNGGAAAESFYADLNRIADTESKRMP